MIKKLSNREKIYALVGGGAVILFIIMQFMIFPVIEKKERLRSLAESKEIVLKQIIDAASRYKAIEQKSLKDAAEMEKRQQGFTLFSFLDSLAGNVGIKDKISYMKPSTSTQSGGKYKISMVEMKINGLSTQQLVSYLHAVETSPQSLHAKRLSITPNKDNTALDIVLEIETYDIQQ